MLKLIKYLRPYKYKLFFMIAFLFLQMMGTLYLPTLMADIVNKGIITGNVGMVWKIGGFMLAVAVLTSGVSIIGTYLSTSSFSAFGRDLRNDLFHKSQELSINSFKHFGSDSMITRCTNDVTQIQQAFTASVEMLLPAPVMTVAGLILAFSKSPYNKEYSHSPNSIKDPEYSINCGVHYLADCQKQARCKSPVDMNHIRLALQGYNYENGYIPWAIKRDGGYTITNAIAFSDIQAKRHGWKSYGDKQYPIHVLRYYPYGSYNIGVGNTAIVKVAEQQLGNHGGKKFWSWYGYSSRTSWCGCFVSWCADQCGYI